MTTDTHRKLNDDLAERFFEDGKRIAAGVTIQRRADDLYDAWTTFEDLPRFIDEVREVSREGSVLRWTVTGPGEQPFSWDAEIINEVPGRLLAWRTVGDGVQNAGSIAFRTLPYERGTEVRVIIEYLPPGGALGSAIASLLGKDPQTLLKRGLFRFRQLMESGEIATNQGQPVGHNPSREDRPGEKPRDTDGDVRDLADGSSKAGKRGGKGGA